MSDQTDTPVADAGGPRSAGPAHFPCRACGAKLEFTPGTTNLTCPFCGHAQPIGAQSDDGDSPDPGPPQIIEEQDFRSTLARLEDNAETYAPVEVECKSCAATVSPPANAESFSCPYCNANIVTTGQCHRLVKPKSVLPFKITRDQAAQLFRRWLASLWFAPNALKRQASVDAAIAGLYLPYWTYDCRTDTPYSGQRGDHYYVTVPYVAVVNGRTVTRLRRERRTRWTPASGRVANRFDDLLILASRSLPEPVARKLEPWDLEDLTPYDDAYLAGFIAERYQIDLAQGFVAAQTLMRPMIETTIRADIGGDEQRILQYSPTYHDITFKHLLLPLWISSFRYLNKVYRFYVNARTGEVTGERPYSYWKIAAAILAGLLLIGVIVLIIAATQGN